MSSRRDWPLRSLDPSLLDFFLWGILKGKVCQNNPRAIALLEENIRWEIELGSAEQLVQTFGNMKRHVQACLYAVTFSTSVDIINPIEQGNL